MSVILRTRPVLLDGPGVVVFQVDLGGAAAPVTIYLENMDLAAEFTTELVDPNANLRFVARTPGSAGNSIQVEAVLDPSRQDVGVQEVGTVVTIQIPGAADRLIPYARRVADAVNSQSTLVRAELVGDGTSEFDFLGRVGPTIVPLTSLAGGFDAAATGAVEVAHAPTPAGPWDVSAPASTALSAVGANAVKAFNIVDTPIRGLRLKADRGTADTRVVATLVRGR